MEELETLEAVPDTTMVVAAHPDDAELCAGATLAKWIAAGCRVTLVVATDGAAGSGDACVDANAIRGIRRREQFDSARALGVAELVMLAHPDGGVAGARDLLSEIVRLIRRHHPHTVLTHDARRYREFVHRDHRAVGEAVEDAIYPYARDHLHFPEQLRDGLAPHKVRELMLWDTDEPNTIVNVTGFVSAQATALAAHASQLPGLPCGLDPEPWLTSLARTAAGGHSFEHGQRFRRLIAPD